jgi:hypothetical protein
LNKLTIFDNHVYMIICEVTLTLYLESYCSDYQSYCRIFGENLKHDTLSPRQSSHYLTIDSILEKLFNMGVAERNKYFIDYFLLRKYVIFEIPVRLMVKVNTHNTKLIDSFSL